MNEQPNSNTSNTSLEIVSSTPSGLFTSPPEPQEVKITIEDIQTVKDVFSTLIKAKPKGFSKNSIAPYYTEKSAIELKGILDDMIQDRQDRAFDLNDHPQISKQTLRTKIYQSFEFLIVHMDPTGIYEKLRREVEIKKGRNTINIKFLSIKIVKTGDKLVAHKIEDTTKDYISQVSDYLQNPDTGNQALNIIDIHLSNEEIIKLKLLLDPLKETCSYKILPNRILVMKVKLIEPEQPTSK